MTKLRDIAQVKSGTATQPLGVEHEVLKPEKICICRMCEGSGQVRSDVVYPMYQTFNVCPQCGGKGRVRVSARMFITIKQL